MARQYAFQTPSTISALTTYAAQKLYILETANMAVDTDQPFTKVFSGTTYVITKIVGVRVSGAFNTACAGGIYNGTGKPAGGVLVAAAQSWANLTGAGKMVDCTLAALNGTDFQAATPYLSLTTANGAALVAKIHIFGFCLD